MSNSRSMESNGLVDSYVTNDLSFAAYLRMLGHKLLKACKVSGTYKFYFEKPDNINKLKVQYINSDCAKFDASVRDLKKILFSDR